MANLKGLAKDTAIYGLSSIVGRFLNYLLVPIHTHCMPKDSGDYGVSVQSVVKHVYNMNRTFFSQPDYEDVKSYVQQFLLRNSKSSQSLVERTERRGYYRLNTGGSTDARQLMLQFREAQEEKTEEKPRQDLSLDLFSD